MRYEIDLHPQAKDEALSWNDGSFAEHQAIGRMVVVIDELEAGGPAERPAMERRPCCWHRGVPLRRTHTDGYEMVYAEFEASHMIAILAFREVRSAQDRIDTDRLARDRLAHFL